MATTYTTRKALTALLIIVASTLLSLPRSEATAPVTGIVSETVTTEDQAAYDSVIATFTAAGFEVPVFRAEFHATEDGCQGFRGLHVAGDDGVATIHVCATHSDSKIQASWRARTLLHEVAHAWIDQNVTEDTKASFIETRGVDNWADGSQGWEHRGTEHAAEVLMWGLQGGEYEIDFRLDGDTTDELTTAFAALTK